MISTINVTPLRQHNDRYFMLDSATPKMKRYGVNDSDSFSDWLPNRRHRASATLWNISLTETLLASQMTVYNGTMPDFRNQRTMKSLSFLKQLTDELEAMVSRSIEPRNFTNWCTEFGMDNWDLCIISWNDIVTLYFLSFTFIVLLQKCAIHPVFICPIAIAYSMGQIIKSFCVCVSVRVSSLSRSHFFVDFHQIGHRDVLSIPKLC